MNRTWKIVLPMVVFGATSLAAQAAPAAAPAQRPAAGVVRVQMKMVGTRYVFEPANFSVRVGQTVEFVNVTGMPHNIQFEPGRIPAGAADILNRNMTGRLGPLQGPMMTTAGQTYRVTFTGAPVGQYGYFCLPHKALGMTGVITVTQ